MSALRAPGLVLIAVVFGLAATLLWRAALVEIGGVALGTDLFGQLKQLTTSWRFWVGVAALLVVMVITLDLYSSEDLSRVIPMYSLSYVAIAVIGRFWLGEAVDLARWIGIALILAGVGVLVRT